MLQALFSHSFFFFLHFKYYLALKLTHQEIELRLKRANLFFERLYFVNDFIDISLSSYKESIGFPNSDESANGTIPPALLPINCLLQAILFFAAFFSILRFPGIWFTKYYQFFGKKQGKRSAISYQLTLTDINQLCDFSLRIISAFSTIKCTWFKTHRFYPTYPRTFNKSLKKLRHSKQKENVADFDIIFFSIIQSRCKPFFHFHKFFIQKIFSSI